MNTPQKDLKFLLKNGWRLINADMVESPDKSIITKEISRAALAWRAKLKAHKLMKRHENIKRFKSWINSFLNKG